MRYTTSSKISAAEHCPTAQLCLYSAQTSERFEKLLDVMPGLNKIMKNIKMTGTFPVLLSVDVKV